MSIETTDDRDNPEWTDDDFARAKPAHDVLSTSVLSVFPKTRGRPKQAKIKKQYTIRLDHDVVDRLRQDGPGWQTRLNDILRKAILEIES